MVAVSVKKYLSRQAGWTDLTLNIMWLMGLMLSIGMLVETSNALAQGRLDSRTTVSGSDELGTLGTTINAMADNLQRSE